MCTFHGFISSFAFYLSCPFIFTALCGGRRGRIFLPLKFPINIGSLNILHIFLLYYYLSTTMTPSFRRPLTWFYLPYASPFSGALLPSKDPVKPSDFLVDATKLPIDLFLVYFYSIKPHLSSCYLGPTMLSFKSHRWIPSVNNLSNKRLFLKPHHPLM